MPSNRVRINYRLWVKPIPKPSGLSMSYSTLGILAALFAVLVITMAIQSGSSSDNNSVSNKQTAVVSTITSVVSIAQTTPISPPNNSVVAPVDSQQSSPPPIDCPPYLEGKWLGTWTSSVTSSFSGTWNSSVQANGSSFTGSVTLIGPTTSTVSVEGSISCSDMTLKVPGLFEAVGKLDATGRNVSGSYHFISSSDRGVWNGSLPEDLSTPLVSAPPPTLIPVSPTPKPTTGTLQIELRHADGSAIVETRANLFRQDLDINGLPILGEEVSGSRTTSGNSGLATFTVEPGTYVVLLELPGSRFQPQGGSWDFQSWPGVANLTVKVGETTQVSLRMGLVTSNLHGAYESCLIVENPDGSKYNASCKRFSEDISRVEILPGTYHLSFSFGDLVQGYSDVGLVTVSSGQTIEKHCTATGAPFQVATCN